VPRRLEHEDAARAEQKLVAVGDAAVDAGNSGRVGPRADDRAAGSRLELEISAGVVAVMVRVQDMRQRPAAGAELAKDRLDLGRIDRGGHSGLRIVHEKSVVVRQTREHMHLKFAHRSLRPSIVPRSRVRPEPPAARARTRPLRPAARRPVGARTAADFAAR